MTVCLRDVRLTPKSGHLGARVELSAKGQKRIRRQDDAGSKSSGDNPGFEER